MVAHVELCMTSLIPCGLKAKLAFKPQGARFFVFPQHQMDCPSGFEPTEEAAGKRFRTRALNSSPNNIPPSKVN